MKATFSVLILSLTFYTLNAQQVVEPVDFQKYLNLYTPPLTEDSARAIGEMQFQEVREKTLNRVLPTTPMYREDGSTTDLSTLTQNSCMVNFVKTHCSWGQMEAEEFLPYCLKTRDIKVICVIVRDSLDDKDNSDLLKLQSSLGSHYEEVYIMEDSVALRINVRASPTRYYFDDKGVLYALHPGVNPKKERLCEEIDRNMN